MKLQKIINACSSIEFVYSLYLPFQKSRKIMEMQEQAKKDVIFYSEKEMALTEKYALKENGKPKIENGKISFSSYETMQEFGQKRDELRDTDIEWDFPVIQITEKEMGDQCISGKDIENLKGFIEFGGE